MHSLSCVQQDRNSRLAGNSGASLSENRSSDHSQIDNILVPPGPGMSVLLFQTTFKCTQAPNSLGSLGCRKAK